MFGEKCDSKNHQIRVSPKISDQTGEGDADGWFLWSYWMTIKYHAPNEQRDPDNHYLLLQDCGFFTPYLARSCKIYVSLGLYRVFRSRIHKLGKMRAAQQDLCGSTDFWGTPWPWLPNCYPCVWVNWGLAFTSLSMKWFYDVLCFKQILIYCLLIST